jgi:hypothetical protein
MKHLFPPLALAFGLCGALFLVPVPIAAAEPKDGAPKEAPVDYSRDVRPILSKNCFACHGPDAAHRMRKLRLDVRAEATKQLASTFTPIVPGDLDNSELYRRITAEDDLGRMPPKKAGPRLKPAEVAVLKRWIEQGAPYADHWAFVKPQARPLPEVKDKEWVRNGIDAWVLSRLEKEGLQPAPQADRFALLRRASLDLRGLPPTPEDVDAFAKDSAPDAYEKAVDRFLKDTAYGERWARVWLDQARYADSAGYGSDPLRTIWRYRDWVIDAFNRNLPYDQFTIEQLAGDLLPEATNDHKIATAFHRNTMTNTEGGTDREEFRVAAVKDRVDTTFQVWMGLTMGCAKCHDHKFDPIGQKEYYRFYAIFNQTADADRADEGPVMPAPTPEMEAKAKEIDARVAELRKQLDTPTPEIAAAQAKWEAELQSHSEWVVLEPESAKASSGTTFKALPDKSLLAEGTNPTNDVYTVTAKADLKNITAFRLEALPDASLPEGGSGRAADGNFVLSRFHVTALPAGQDDKAATGRYVRVDLPGDDKILSLAEVQVFSGGENVARTGKAEQSSTDFDGSAALAIDGNTDGDYGAKSTTHTRRGPNPWWEVKLHQAHAIDRIVIWNRTDGGLHTRLAGCRVQLLDDAHRVVWQQELAEPPNPKRELSPTGRLTVTLGAAFADFAQDTFAVANVLNAAAKNTGWAVAPKTKEAHASVFVAKEPFGIDKPAVLTIRLEHQYKRPNYTLGRFRLSVTNDPQLIRRAALPAAVLAILDTDAAKRTAEQQETLARHYRSVAPSLQPVRDEIAKLEKSRPVVPTVPVMVELPPDQRRETRVLIKGSFLSPGEKVEAGTPAFLPPLPAGAPKDRLALAKWLVNPDNPLTARVAVNRYWAQLFGNGIVETEEDFGTQGELPTNPELLDFLAAEYIRLKWDTKALLRLIVTSATYRQSARVTPELAAKDPHNRLLARGPRFRLEAEMVRDQALQISGLLSRKMHGPSVYPPQPPGLWQAAFNGQRTWATSTGEDKYRRGLYTFWRRTIPYPSMTTFDAPSREVCVVRRIRTNTPLQAFVTLNDPVYIEAAQALARRIVQEGGAGAEERARYGLRLALARPPSDEQVKKVVELYESEREHYRKDAKAAMAMATDPLGPLPAGMQADELAAWTVIANVLLNLDGVLTKG